MSLQNAAPPSACRLGLGPPSPGVLHLPAAVRSMRARKTYVFRELQCVPKNNFGACTINVVSVFKYIVILSYTFSRFDSLH